MDRVFYILTLIDYALLQSQVSHFSGGQPFAVSFGFARQPPLRTFPHTSNPMAIATKQMAKKVTVINKVSVKLFIIRSIRFIIPLIKEGDQNCE